MEKTGKKKAKKYVLTSGALRIRKGPSLDSEVLGIIRELGGIREISSTRKGFGKLANEPGWICLDFAEMIK